MPAFAIVLSDDGALSAGEIDPATIQVTLSPVKSIDDALGMVEPALFGNEGSEGAEQEAFERSFNVNDGDDGGE